MPELPLRFASLGLMNITWLPACAALLFTPLIMRALARAFPTRPADPEEYQWLHHQYHGLELASQLAAIVGVVGSLVLPTARWQYTWLVGAAFGWLVLHRYYSSPCLLCREAWEVG
jgi:hypothetical protein